MPSFHKSLRRLRTLCELELTLLRDKLNTMASAQDLQALLRFLSQDAKVPLAQALGKVKDLQAAKLNT